ncbi:MAG: GlmU family protein [Bacteroidales bacterium]
MNFILFDDQQIRNNLLPLTFMRPVAEIRIGILTIREKWEKLLNVSTSTLTENYLGDKYPMVKGEINMLINGAVCPDEDLLKAINKLKSGQVLIGNDIILALCIEEAELSDSADIDLSGIDEIEYSGTPLIINNTWDIFSLNGEALQCDFELITKGRKSEKPSATNRILGDMSNLFIEPGAKVEMATINLETGPVYIGKDAHIMEGCMIRGPLALCEGSTLKMGAKIYGPTTVGPYSKVGGEVNNSVFFGYSNKAHDGFLGNSVIAEWCNLGADTNNSNLKNSYDKVRLWNYPQSSFVDTGLQFCGLIMGDHSKTAIGTMFNTGTVVGVNCNIFGSGFHRNFVPSFSWGGTAGFKIYNLKKAIQVAEAVYSRRNKEFDETEKELLSAVFDLTAANRYL